MSEIIQGFNLDEKTRKLIYEELPRIFQQHPLLKYVVWDICADKFADKKRTEDRFELLLEELRKDRERSDRRFEKFDQRIDKLQEELRKDRELNEKRFEVIQEELRKDRELKERRFNELQENLRKEFKEELNKERERSDRRFEEVQERLRKEFQETLEKERERSDKRFEEVREELRKDRELNEKRFEEMQKEWNKRFKKMEERTDKKFEKLIEKIGSVDKRIDRTIGALGARWGLCSEKAFRDAIRGILGELTNYKVERFQGYDKEGIVFGRPDQIELDVVIKNGQTWLIEIKSSVSKADVYIFQRKVEFYEREKKVKVDKKIIISPMVENAALDLAKDFGIKVYSQPEDVEI